MILHIRITTLPVTSLPVCAILGVGTDTAATSPRFQFQELQLLKNPAEYYMMLTYVCLTEV